MPGTSPAAAPGKVSRQDRPGQDEEPVEQSAQNPAGVHPETNDTVSDAPTGLRPPGDPERSNPSDQRASGSAPEAASQGASTALANPMAEKELFGPLQSALDHAARQAESEGAREHAQTLRKWASEVQGWLNGKPASKL